MQRILLNVQAFEKEFARKQMDCYQDDKKKELATKRKELSRLKQRTSEIDNLIQRLYEDNVSGKISDERYATLSISYEEEQKQIKAEIPKLESYLSSETDKSESLQKFINKVKQITELKELTPEEMENAFQHHLSKRKQKNGIANATPLKSNTYFKLQKAPLGTHLPYEGCPKGFFF